VSGLFNIEDLLDPGDDLVGAGVGGLVHVDDSVLEVLLEGALERSVAGGDGRVVRGEHIHFVVVLQQQGPLFRLYFRAFLRRFNNVLLFNDLFVDLRLLLNQSFLFFI
jgi:hypothetical protein